MTPPRPGPTPADQGEEGAEARDGAEGGDVAVHVLVLRLREERVLALDPAALHVLVPALGVVGPNQGSLTLARAVELDVLHLVLAQGKEEKTVQKRAGGSAAASGFLRAQGQHDRGAEGTDAGGKPRQMT